MSKRIAVTVEDLAKAMTVWLRVMPKRIWQELESHHLLARSKRQGTKPDVQRAVAEHLAGQFERVRWEVSRDQPENIYSDHLRDDVDLE